jgi:hypothetical protein
MPNIASKVCFPLELKDGNVLSRRRFGALASAGVLFGSSFLLLVGNMAEAQEGKTSKEIAKYQEQPKDGHSCAICQFFHAPHTCQLVEGDVSPNGWCSYWSKKV